MNISEFFICFKGIVIREALRFIHQRERFFSALVRPLVWLGIFAAGFRSVLGVAIIPPYETYITYEVYIAPGLIAMIQLFNGMQSSLSMVYDREMGSMKEINNLNEIKRKPKLVIFFTDVKTTSWGICINSSSLCFFNYCIFLGYYSTNQRIYNFITCFNYIGTNAWFPRHVFILSNQTTRKLCRCNEFCYFSNVFCFISTLPSLEN